MNTMKTFFLMLVLSSILLLAGYIIGNGSMAGIFIALIFAGIMNIGVWFFSDKIALAMAGAHEVSESQDPELHQIVNEQTMLARMPKPKVYIINNDSPNAFATGRSPKHAAVAVTTGIRRILTRQELGAVLAHELGHVGNRDTLIMAVAATIAGAIGMLAYMAQWAMLFGGMGGGDRDRGNGGGGNAVVGIVGLLVLIIVLPLVATLIRLAISRAREYQADATGAKTSGHPEALASALEKLDATVHRRPMQVNQGISHLFIVNPLSGKSLVTLFSTHPPIEERIKRLRAMRPF